MTTDTFASEAIDVDLNLTSDDEEICICNCPKVATHIGRAKASCDCVPWARMLLCMEHAKEALDHLGHMEFCTKCDSPLTWISITPING